MASSSSTDHHHNHEYQREISFTTNRQYFTDDESDEEERERELEDEEEEITDGDHNDNDDENDKEPRKKGFFYTCGVGRGGRRPRWWLGEGAARVLDPRAKWVQEWNRVFLLVCATGLFVDPLFFYAISISDTCMCLFVDGWFAVTVTVLRCMTDALHVWNMWLQLKMAKRSFSMVGAVEGTGTASTGLRDATARSVALRYLKAKRGFLFDLFVILPLPQVN